MRVGCCESFSCYFKFQVRFIWKAYKYFYYAIGFEINMLNTRYISFKNFYKSYTREVIRVFLKKITIFWKNQAPGPIANERSQNSASDALIKSSGNLNPTDLVTKKRQKLEKWSFPSSFSTFFPSGWLPDILGPISNERSQNSASDALIDSSVRPNLTHFMSVQSSKIHVFFFLFFIFFHFSCFFHKPLFPSPFALLETTRGQMGNTIYLCFYSEVKIIPILPPIPHLSSSTFPWYSLGTRTKGQPPYGGRPFVLCPETSGEKVTTGRMGYDQ